MLKKFPKIKDDKLFEILVRDVMQIKLGITLSLYGRQGQAQNGIDLYTSGENRIVVQCKDYLSDKSQSEIETVLLYEIDKTKKLNFTFKQFWIATALDRDVNIQNTVENIQNNLKGNTYILFWDDIEEILSYNANIVVQYYPQYLSINQNYASLIFLGFFSQVFADYIDLMRFERTSALLYCDCIENGLNWVTNNNTKKSLQVHLTEIRNYLNGPLDMIHDFKLENEFYWCQTVQQNICSIQYSLENNCLTYFRIGISLGKLDHLLNFSKKTQINDSCIDELKKSINDLNLRKSDKKKIKNYFERLTDKNTKYNVPFDLFIYLCNIV